MGLGARPPHVCTARPAFVQERAVLWRCCVWRLPSFLAQMTGLAAWVWARPCSARACAPCPARRGHARPVGGPAPFFAARGRPGAGFFQLLQAAPGQYPQPRPRSGTKTLPETCSIHSWAARGSSGCPQMRIRSNASAPSRLNICHGRSRHPSSQPPRAWSCRPLRPLSTRRPATPGAPPSAFSGVKLSMARPGRACGRRCRLGHLYHPPQPREGRQRGIWRSKNPGRTSDPVTAKLSAASGGCAKPLAKRRSVSRPTPSAIARIPRANPPPHP